MIYDITYSILSGFQNHPQKSENSPVRTIEIWFSKGGKVTLKSEMCPKFYKQNPEKNPAVVWPLLGGNAEMIHWKLGGLKHLF